MKKSTPGIVITDLNESNGVSIFLFYLASLKRFAHCCKSRLPLIKELDNSLSDRSRFAFKVVDENAGIIIGHAEIYLTEKSAYLGRILIGDKQLRGKGYWADNCSSTFELRL